MIVNKSEFLKALQLVGKAINPRPIMPLLGNILFEVQEDNAMLFATNYELSIKTSVSVKGKQSFEAAIPARLVTDFVSLLRDETVNITFEKSSNEMLLKTETSKNKVNCIDPKDYPSIALSNGKGIKIPAHIFCDAVSRVSFAASIQAGLLNGVQITNDNGKLVLFATDGIHLSYEEIEIDKKYKAYELNAIIPSGALNTISKILDADEELLIAVSNNQVHFRCDKTDIVSQKLDGKFPDYKLLKATKPVTTITIDTALFLQSCKQASLFCEETGNVKINIQELPLIEMSASAKEQGNSVMNIPCVKTGKALILGANVLLIKQFLENCSSKNTVIELTDEKSFIVFKMDERQDFYHIIMPMALL